nr:unnamed protein product [Callosobruchus chinensis]
MSRGQSYHKRCHRPFSFLDSTTIQPNNANQSVTNTLLSRNFDDEGTDDEDLSPDVSEYVPSGCDSLDSDVSNDDTTLIGTEEYRRWQKSHDVRKGRQKLGLEISEKEIGLKVSNTFQPKE